jgi:hypothetical protein
MGETPRVIPISEVFTFDKVQFAARVLSTKCCWNGFTHPSSLGALSGHPSSADTAPAAVVAYYRHRNRW